MADVTLNRAELKAISSDARIEILKLLKERRHTLSELAGKMNMKMPSAKEHLDKLLVNDMVQVLDEGHKWKYYQLTKKGQKLLEPEASIFIMFGTSLVAFLAAVFYAAYTFSFNGFSMYSAQAPLMQNGLANKTVESASTVASGAVSNTASEMAISNATTTVTNEALDAGVRETVNQAGNASADLLNQNISTVIATQPWLSWAFIIVIVALLASTIFFFVKWRKAKKQKVL